MESSPPEKAMTTYDQNRWDAAVTIEDQIGKVFIALGEDKRKCLICDDVFNLQGAAEHSEMLCFPPRAGF
jgi:hypothetical protein